MHKNLSPAQLKAIQARLESPTFSDSDKAKLILAVSTEHNLTLDTAQKTIDSLQFLCQQGLTITTHPTTNNNFPKTDKTPPRIAPDSETESTYQNNPEEDSRHHSVRISPIENETTIKNSNPPEKPTRGPRKPPRGIITCNTALREDRGLRDRLISSLTPDELQELAGVYVLEGYDALATRYGLTRGEIITLLSTPAWLTIIKQVASTIRGGLVTSAMLAIPRLQAAIESKAEKATMGELLEAINTLKEVFLEVSGMTNPATNSGSIEPSDIGDEERKSLQKLSQHLSGLASAGLMRGTPRSTILSRPATRDEEE